MKIQDKPVRVLLIDDDKDDYALIRDLLSGSFRTGFQFRWASDYDAGLAALLAGECDVCLLDYRLGKRGGLELLKEAVARSVRIPIIFLTGHGFYELDLEAMSSGAADYLTKDRLSGQILERSICHALERRRGTEELLNARRVIQTLSDCNNAVIHINDERKLLEEICRIIVEVGGYRMAWVGFTAHADVDQAVIPVAFYGYEEGYLEMVKVTWRDSERGRDPAGTAIRTGSPSIVRSVPNHTGFEPWKEAAIKRGYASVIGLPLFLKDRTLGAITIYASQPDAFDMGEAELLVKLSQNLSYGIQALRTNRTCIQARKALRNACTHLKRRATGRTADLMRVNAELKREIEERRQSENDQRISLRFLEIVHKHTNITSLLEESISEIRDYTGCDAVGIRVLDDDGNIPYQAYGGFSEEFYESENFLSIKSDECMCINVIRGDVDPILPFYTEGGSFCVNATTRFLATVSEEDKGRTRNRCNSEGYETVALFPFRSGKKILGLIHVADHRENMLPPNMVKTLEKAAMQLGTAFQRALTESKLRESGEHYRYLFDNMLNGFAYCKMIFEKNRPVDFVYLNVNKAFETLTGLTNVVGKKVSQVIPGIRESDPELLEIYGRVALTAVPKRFETYVDALEMWFSIAVYSPCKGCFVAIFDVITERKQAEQALRDSLEEKVALLKEVHHRVKNNLQIVDSLLNLQANRLENHEMVDVVRDTRNRVRSMALLHEVLYRSGNLARINFASYVGDLCRQLVRSFGPTAGRVKVENHIVRIGLPLEHSVPCGLIINELVSNALKHGFVDGRAGKVTVELERIHEKQLALWVRDDGVGLPPCADPANASTLGLQLVSNLAGQLGGQLTVERQEGVGAAFRVVFPVPEDALPGGES